MQQGQAGASLQLLLGEVAPLDRDLRDVIVREIKHLQHLQPADAAWRLVKFVGRRGESVPVW